MKPLEATVVVVVDFVAVFVHIVNVVVVNDVVVVVVLNAIVVALFVVMDHIDVNKY